MCTSLPFGFEDVVFDCIISLSLPFCLLSIRYINKGEELFIRCTVRVFGYWGKDVGFDCVSSDHCLSFYFLRYSLCTERQENFTLYNSDLMW